MIYAKVTGYAMQAELHYDSDKNVSFIYGDERLKFIIENESVDFNEWPPDFQWSIMLPPDTRFLQIYKLELLERLSVEWLSAHPALIAPDNVEI